MRGGARNVPGFLGVQPLAGRGQPVGCVSRPRMTQANLFGTGFYYHDSSCAGVRRADTLGSYVVCPFPSLITLTLGPAR